MIQFSRYVGKVIAEKMCTVILVTLLLSVYPCVYSNWADWWTYDGISGPAYWGLINPAWTMCNKVGIVFVQICHLHSVGDMKEDLQLFSF